jgi:hypothetical protein
VDLFARIASQVDFDVLNEIESLTNERLRDESGEALRVAESDRAKGPGSSYIMAPFVHAPPAGGRFTSGGQGAWYGARHVETAIRETIHHRQVFMRATAEPPIDLEMRVIEADIDGRFHDIRAHRDELPGLYASDDYSLSQSWARRLRAEGSNGVAYASVRHEGGECVAVFKPRLVKRARQAKHLLYRWDGTRISEVFELTLRLRDEPGRVQAEGE